MSALVGLDNVINRLREIKARLADMGAPIQAAGVYMLGSIDKTFAAQGRPTPWSPLKPSTLKRKRGGSILVSSGRMRASNQLNATANGFVIRNTTPYSAFHLLGTTRTAQRNFLLFQAEDKPQVANIFRHHIWD